MIRLAQKKDSERIMILLRQVLNIHHNQRPDIFKANATKYTENELEKLLEDENYVIFVFTDDEDCTQGYAFCIKECFVNSNNRTDIKTLYIDDLCVDETMQRQGIGTALYQHVCEYAKANGFYNVTLNVWYENKDALAFYEKCGLKVQKMGMEIIL